MWGYCHHLTLFNWTSLASGGDHRKSLVDSMILRERLPKRGSRNWNTSSSFRNAHLRDNKSTV
ncbi:hypothetical protein QCA50_018919 [Cerrena zonata]|uniref:Uncharacterized protein n=1 Tax=Cerrena zonata TaxID=2478898 RepID=A0AAW0FCJ5_9APHY